VALLVAVGAAVDARLRVDSRREEAAPVSEGAEAAADAAFESVRQAIAAAQKAPRAERARALDRVGAACEAFLGQHGVAASRDQLSVAGHYWLQAAEDDPTTATLTRALNVLDALEDLPADLERAARLQAARLRTRPGELAPAWTLQGRSGPLSSREQSGTVLLSFWATWNPHCRDLLRQRLAPLARRHPALTLIHVGVAGNGESLEGQEEHLASIRCGGVAAFDAGGSCAEAFGVNGTPFLCLIGPEGRVLARGPGLATIASVERLLTRR
jgi:hypothetical protein